jgi:hypothetical protein
VKVGAHVVFVHSSQGLWLFPLFAIVLLPDFPSIVGENLGKTIMKNGLKMNGE